MLFLCNRKFRWNSLLHKKALCARKRSSVTMPESGDVVNLDENCFADSQVKMIFCYTMEQYLSAEM